MIDSESAPEFVAAKWLANWLAAPLPALGGATPASFLNAVERRLHGLLDKKKPPKSGPSSNPCQKS